MRLILPILLTLFATPLLAQCGREYPSGFYHISAFVNAHGDTLNQLDANGLYHGLHLMSIPKSTEALDSITYLQGVFEHGVPQGDWIDHCKDGSYSTGPFNRSSEVSSDGKGGWITKKHGIYDKIGVWKYYSASKVLQKTMRYDRTTSRKGWLDQTFEMDSSRTFVCTEYRFNSKHNRDARLKKQIRKSFTPKGIPISADYDCFWHTKSYEYDESGQLRHWSKQKKRLGKPGRIVLEKQYNAQGQLELKTRTKIVRRDFNRIINESW